MGVRFSIAYHHLVVEEDIPKLPKIWKDKIKQTIEIRLVIKPELYGRPLRKSLKGYRKLRVGDYRVIFRIEKTKVKIFVIQHRSVVYETIFKRIM